MIAEEPILQNIPDLSVSTGKTMSFIIETILGVSTAFKKAIKQSNLIKPFNENKLTQIFVEQIEVRVKPNPFVGVKNQYSDLFFGTKGIPDFYFHVVEEGISHLPLFVVESKRLPSPSYEKEYVIGEKRNGGIERFKLEKHGKGLTNCGMLGFIEKDRLDFWLKSVNIWIEELSKFDNSWKIDEKLREVSGQSCNMHLNSIVHTLNSGDMLLHHFWIILNDD